MGNSHRYENSQDSEAYKTFWTKEKGENGVLGFKRENGQFTDS